MSEPPTITIERREGGLFLVGEWPEHMAATDSLLAQAAIDDYVSEGDGMLRIWLANGTALYGRIGERPHGISLFRLLSTSSTSLAAEGN